MVGGETIKRAIIKSQIECADANIYANEVWNVASGVEVAFNNLGVYGRFRVTGIVSLFGKLTLGASGRLSILGKVSVGV